MNQQDQTLDFFRSHAQDWQNKATDQVYSVIDNRHNAVLESMKSFPEGSSLLDVGCGTGQLAIHASKSGWNAVGIDFAQEMIDQCIANNVTDGGTASFACASVFDYDPPAQSHDVISAQGFIEYISLDQLDQFLDFVSRTLRKDGVLAVGSRNRLFNIHTLNAFTELETALGTVGNLMIEAQILQTAPSQAEAIAQLDRLGFEYAQPTHHPITGIQVDTRYQFSPSDLMLRLKRHGLAASRIFPVHYHALPVSLLADPEFKQTHLQFARHASDQWITQHQLVPYSSSYVLEARKQ